ncbi:hypothetical protein K435DRAFT_796061 [Dendrothele bispora CBS 962.96]|uniref:Uncharacterized protein n=1 Tax=Dendrothele bispora (strain CBS 962.96) TaxID=1314807 RepID=A0A4S8M6P0_DENBC|nr:hypothetical protein K435DRAFT_796061 [Dendrothele bispora CBS 962.96]
MPNEIKGHYSQFGGAISEMATESLKRWRNSIGEAAITTVGEILDGKNEEERKTFIEEQIKSGFRKRPYYYPGNNARRSEEVFQSRIVSETFATHFKFIENIPDNSRSEALPKGALVLSILAIDRAFVLSQNGIHSGDFSSYQWAKEFSPRIHRWFGKRSDGQDRINTQIWSKIIAAAKSHVKPPTSNITRSEDDEEMLDDFQY